MTRARRATLCLSLWALCAVACGGPKEPPETSVASPRYRAVSPGVAAAMLRDNPDLVVFDVRSFAEYSSSSGHLKRAVSAPLTELGVLWIAAGLTADDTVLLYSGDGGASQQEASATLINHGLRFVVQIEGGLEAWIGGGFEVQVEDAPLSPRRPHQP